MSSIVAAGSARNLLHGNSRITINKRAKRLPKPQPAVVSDLFNETYHQSFQQFLKNIETGIRSQLRSQLHSNEASQSELEKALEDVQVYRACVSLSFSSVHRLLREDQNLQNIIKTLRAEATRRDDILLEYDAISREMQRLAIRTTFSIFGSRRKEDRASCLLKENNLH